MCCIVYRCKGYRIWSKAVCWQLFLLQLWKNSNVAISCRWRALKLKADCLPQAALCMLCLERFFDQGELHLHADLWTCRPVKKTWAGSHCQHQCPEPTPSSSLRDSVIGFVAPVSLPPPITGLWMTHREEVGPLTSPPLIPLTCIATGQMSLCCN